MSSYKAFYWRQIGVKLAAILTFIMGVINLTSGVQPALHARLQILEQILPLEIRHGSRITSVLAGFGLILLANNLSRRKKAAWFFSMALLLITGISHLFKGLDYEEAIFSLLLVIILFLLRNEFHAASDPPSVKQGLTVLGAAFGFTLIYGVVGFFMLDQHFDIPFNLISTINQIILMFVTFSTPVIQPVTKFGHYFLISINIIGLTTIGFAILMLIRPVLIRHPATQKERELASAIANQFGRTALTRATLFEDKSYFFSGEDTYCAYVTKGRGAIVLGDPVGPAEKVPEAIVQFRDYCAKKDWLPAFVSTLPDYLPAYQAAGFKNLCIGFEAIVPLKQFTLEGSKNKDLRNAVSKLERGGFRAEIIPAPLDDSLLKSLHQVSNAWLTLRQGMEMRFSDGWFQDDTIRACKVIVIYNPENQPIAFANFVHEYRKNEITIDLMRHYPQVPNGTMEFLFVRMLQWAQTEGFDSFSLGLSALAGIGEKEEDPRVERAFHTLSTYFSRYFNFSGLRHFKEKFHPDWEPRYLVYPGTGSLTVVINSLIQVHTGEGALMKVLSKK